jgi:hypothetical protein
LGARPWLEFTRRQPAASLGLLAVHGALHAPLPGGGRGRAPWIPESHNLPFFAEGIPGPESLARQRAHAGRYGVAVMAELRKPPGGHFEAGVEAKAGGGGAVRRVRARRVLLATGAVDVEPDLPDACGAAWCATARSATATRRAASDQVLANTTTSCGSACRSRVGSPRPCPRRAARRLGGGGDRHPVRRDVRHYCQRRGGVDRDRAADPEDDPWEEATWIKANPSWGQAVQPDAIRAIMRQARNNPAQEAAAKTRHLNV